MWLVFTQSLSVGCDSTALQGKAHAPSCVNKQLLVVRS